MRALPNYIQYETKKTKLRISAQFLGKNNFLKKKIHIKVRCRIINLNLNKNAATLDGKHFNNPTI